MSNQIKPSIKLTLDEIKVKLECVKLIMEIYDVDADTATEIVKNTIEEICE